MSSSEFIFLSPKFVIRLIRVICSTFASYRENPSVAQGINIDTNFNVNHSHKIKSSKQTQTKKNNLANMVMIKQATILAFTFYGLSAKVIFEDSEKSAHSFLRSKRSPDGWSALISGGITALLGTLIAREDQTVEH